MYMTTNRTNRASSPPAKMNRDKQDEQGEQSAGEDEQVLAFQPLELRAAADSLVDRILRHNQRKNERKIVAATIKKIQAPNQLAAVLEVSGSPEENLE